MNIELIYGSGEVAKRNYLLTLKKKFSPDAVTVVDLKQKSLKELEEVLISRFIFEVRDRLIVVENTPKNLDILALPKFDEITYLVFVADSIEAAATLLKSAQKVKAKITLFEGEKETRVFPFLDALIEGNKQAFVELNKLLDEYGAVYILTMVYYLLRRNFLSPSKNSTFLTHKIQKQKARFASSDWEKLYKLALETDYKIKNGEVEEKVGMTLLVQSFVNFNSHQHKQ